MAPESVVRANINNSAMFAATSAKMIVLGVDPMAMSIELSHSNTPVSLPNY